MRRSLLPLATVIALSARAEAPRDAAPPVVASCGIDLDADGTRDVALLVEGDASREVVVLRRTATGLVSERVASWPARDPRPVLACRAARSVTETDAGPGNRAKRVVEVPGACVEVRLPEGAAAAYHWDGRAFRETWIAD